MRACILTVHQSHCLPSTETLSLTSQDNTYWMLHHLLQGRNPFARISMKVLHQKLSLRHEILFHLHRQRSTQEVHTCWLDCGRDNREPSWRGSGVPSGSTFTWHLQVVVARVLVAVAVTSPASASVQSVSRSVHVPYWSLSGKGGKTLHKQDPDKQSAQKRTLGANDFSAAMSCSGTHFQDLT